MDHSKMDSGSIQCIFCCYKITQDEDLLQCQGCYQWQHRNCTTDVTSSFYADFYRAIVMKEERPTWLCEHCAKIQKQQVSYPKNKLKQGLTNPKLDSRKQIQYPPLQDIPVPSTSSLPDSDDEFIFTRDRRHHVDTEYRTPSQPHIKVRPNIVLIPHRCPVIDDAEVIITYQLIQTPSGEKKVTDSQGHIYNFVKVDEHGTSVYVHETPYLQTKVRVSENIRHFISVSRQTIQEDVPVRKSQETLYTDLKDNKKVKSDKHPDDADFDSSDASSDMTEIYLSVDSSTDEEMPMLTIQRQTPVIHSERDTSPELPHLQPETSPISPTPYPSPSKQHLTAPTDCEKQTRQYIHPETSTGLPTTLSTHSKKGLTAPGDIGRQTTLQVHPETSADSPTPFSTPSKESHTDLVDSQGQTTQVLPFQRTDTTCVTRTPFPTPSKQRKSIKSLSDINGNVSSDTSNDTFSGASSDKDLTKSDSELEADDMNPDITIPYFHSDSEQEATSSQDLTFTVTKTTKTGEHRTMHDDHGYSYNLVSQIGNRKTWYCSRRSSNQCLASVVQRGKSRFLYNVQPHNHSTNSTSTPPPTPASTPSKSSTENRRTSPESTSNRHPRFSVYQTSPSNMSHQNTGVRSTNDVRSVLKTDHTKTSETATNNSSRIDSHNDVHEARTSDNNSIVENTIDISRILPLITYPTVEDDYHLVDKNVTHSEERNKTIHMKDWTPVTSSKEPVIYHEIDSCKKVPKSVLIDSDGYIYTTKKIEEGSSSNQRTLWKCNIFGYSGRCKAVATFNSTPEFHTSGCSTSLSWCVWIENCVSTTSHNHDPNRLTALTAVVKMMLKRMVYCASDSQHDTNGILTAVTCKLHESDRDLLTSKPSLFKSLIHFIKTQKKNWENNCHK